MHDDAHWRAIDSPDLSPDEWLTDPEKYRSWSCILDLSLGAVQSLLLPPTGSTAEVLSKQVAALGSVAACEGLRERLHQSVTD